MTTMTETTPLDGGRLAIDLRRKVDAFEILLRGLDESRADHAPEGRWTPKQIVSHLCGPEGIGIMPPVEAYLEKEMPTIDLVIANPFYTGSRAAMSLADLLEEFEEEYGRLIAVVKGLTAEQLARKARIPVFRETPLGESPTLGDYLNAVAEFHLGFHTEQLQEVLREAA